MEIKTAIDKFAGKKFHYKNEFKIFLLVKGNPTGGKYSYKKKKLEIHQNFEPYGNKVTQIVSHKIEIGKINTIRKNNWEYAPLKADTHRVVILGQSGEL